MWEIYSYGGGDFLRYVFNAIASIFGSNDYMMALRIVAICALLSTIVGSAFVGRLYSLQWLLGMIFVFYGFLLPKVTVHINDRIIPSQSSTVANVPLGLALVVSGGTTFRDWSTRMFETVFSLPGGVKYQNGYMMSQKLVEAATTFEVTDERLKENLSEFWQACVFYDLSLNLYGYSNLTQAPELLQFLQTNTSNARMSKYRDSSGASNFVVCRTLINGQLNSDLTAEVTRATTVYATQLFPDDARIAASNAITRYQSAMPTAYQYITGLARSNSQIILQNALSNSLAKGVTSFASEADAVAAAQDYSLSRAEADRRVTFRTLGEMAKKLLPILQNVFEAFIYAMFPFIGIMLVLPMAHKIAMSYVFAVFWVALWSPLYAFLHFVMSYYGQGEAQALVNTLGAVTPGNNTQLGTLLRDHGTIAGYLSLSIPMIAWMVVSRSGSMMSGLAGRVMQSYDKPVERASDEAASGNIKLNNVGLNTATMDQYRTSYASNAGGVTMYDSSTGFSTQTSQAGTQYTQDVSSTAFSGGLSSMASSSLSQVQSDATKVTNSAAQDYTKATSSAMSDAQQMFKKAEENFSSGSSASSQFRSQYDQSAGDAYARLKTIGEQSGYSVEQIASAAAQLGLGGNLGVKAGAEAGASTSDSERHGLELAERASKDTQFRESISAAASAARGFESSTSTSGAQGGGETKTASFDNVRSSSERVSAAINNEHAISESVSNSKQDIASGSFNLTKAVISSYSNESLAMSDLNAAQRGDGAAIARLQEKVRGVIENFVPQANIDSKADVHDRYNAQQDDLHQQATSGVGAFSRNSSASVAPSVNYEQARDQAAQSSLRVDTSNPTATFENGSAPTALNTVKGEVQGAEADALVHASLVIEAGQNPLPGVRGTVLSGMATRREEDTQEEAKPIVEARFANKGTLNEKDN